MNYHEKLKNKNYVLAVPSRNREELILKKRGFWRHFTKPLSEYNTLLAIREEEKENYRKYYEGVLLTTENETDIVKTRQKILKEAILKGYEYLIMVDDDVQLSFRDNSLSSKYASRLEEFQERELLDQLLYEMTCITTEKYPLTGLPTRQGCFGRKYMFEKNSAIIRFVCYHLPTWKKEGVSCSGLEGGVMEDYYVQLKWLSLGYQTLSHCGFAVDDLGTAYKGGCNATRTVEIQSESARKLKELFPDYVTLKVKQDGKSFWKEDRLDVSLRLKKFLKKGELPYVPKEEINLD